jgi:RimJ/RimL family protein N-acetyltransferase
MVARAAGFSFETHHVARIDLGVAAENIVAIACYRRHGFDHVGTWPQAIRMGPQIIDVCWMTLTRINWVRSLAADAASK